MTSSRRLALAASAALAAVVATPALAAYICHPDPPGTRTLALSGPVARYAVAGPHVSIAVRSGKGCRVVAWNTLTGLHRTTGAACAALPGRALSAPSGVRVSVRRATALRPDTLDVWSGTRRVASWPLPARPRTLDTGGGFAVFGAADGGTYAIRLADGRVAALGPTRAGDVPSVNDLGAVFTERRRYRGETGSLLKFVPASGIDLELASDGRPLSTAGPIRSLAMDGPRVAVAVRDPAGRCDEVLYWNVLRAPVQRISAPQGPTCLPGRATAIPSLAIGGFRTEWLAAGGGKESLVVGSPLCQEWVARRLVPGAGGERVVAMAADGNTLAYAVTDHARELRGLASVEVVTGRYTPRTIVSGRGQPVAIAVDDHTVATAFAGGTVDVRTTSGRRLALLHTGAAEAVALGAGRLVVLRPGALEVYDVASQRRLRTVAIPRTTLASVDVQYGIAVVAADRSALAVDLGTGAKAVVGTGAAPLTAAAIERPGVAFAYERGSRGAAEFVPLARVQELLGRTS